MAAVKVLVCQRPAKSITDTWELITNPFYNNGGSDVGMAWQILASLERVAIGYSMAVGGGCSAWCAGGSVHLGTARPRPLVSGVAHGCPHWRGCLCHWQAFRTATHQQFS